MTSNSDQYGIPCAYIRGGTSKALFLHEKDIPAPGPLRDAVLKRLMGTPDPLQIDGMGGSKHSTSKIAIVGPSKRDDADVDFTFAQVGVDKDTIGYDGNCGNISSGVAPFALDEGIVMEKRKGHNMDGIDSVREVRIYNTGTKKLLISHVPVDQKTGFSISGGDSVISGVPGKGASILMDYRNTIGASRAQGLLPTGRVIDTIRINDKSVDITICDIANICAFVRAKDFEITGYETAKQINEDRAFIAGCKQLRGKAAQLLGMCKDWELADEQAPGLPLVVLVAPPSDDRSDLTARLIFMNSCHDSMAGTGAVCTTGCSRVPGSVVQRVLGPKALESHFLRINHPLGVMQVGVQVSSPESTFIPGDDLHVDIEFAVLALLRTSRRIMEGRVFVPKDVWNPSHTSVAPILTNGAAKPTNSLTPSHFLMTGDINLLNVTDATRPLSHVSPVLHAATAVFSNLECMLSSPQAAHSIHHEGFFANPSLGTRVLHENHISAVGLANNINYGPGILSSIATLDAATPPIPHSGAGATLSEARKPALVTARDGRTFAFLQRSSIYWPTNHAADATAPGIAPLPGHTAYETPMYRYHAGIPPVNRPGIPPKVITWADEAYLAEFVADIGAARRAADVLVASVHWGLGSEVLEYMEQIAHAAIEAGADCVMGHGPHQPLAVGYWKGKPIFYGLGSFSFHTGHLGKAHGSWVGLLAKIQGEEVSFRFVWNDAGNETRFCGARDERAVKTLERLREASRKLGAELVVEGDEVFVRPMEL